MKYYSQMEQHLHSNIFKLIRSGEKQNKIEYIDLHSNIFKLILEQPQPYPYPT